MYRIKVQHKKLPETTIILQKRILGFIWLYWWGTLIYGYDTDLHQKETNETIASLKKDYIISEVIL